MKKKTLSALVLAVALSAVLAGCGDKSDNKAESPVSSASSGSGVTEIKLTATNFEFDQKEIHVKKGDKIKLTLDNKQGMHGFGIPDLKVELNKAGTVEFVADQAGSFDFICSVMCGAGHADMKGKLIVE
jgi:cytochrome c oxidase subunit 2